MPLRSILLCLAATVSPAAGAATVAVAVADAAGRPLADAIVIVEPAFGNVPTRPLAGVQIVQAKRQFSPQVTVVTIGTPVTFPNLDTVRHHVYSFSPAKSFELKLYAGSPPSPVVFDKPGIAVLGCNIHDQMMAWVVVVDTPFFGRTGANGRAAIADVPAGSWRVRAWHPGLTGAEPAPLATTVAATDVEQRIQLAVAPGPR